ITSYSTRVPPGSPGGPQYSVVTPPELCTSTSPRASPGVDHAVPLLSSQSQTAALESPSRSNASQAGSEQQSGSRQSVSPSRSSSRPSPHRVSDAAGAPQSAEQLAAVSPGSQVP